MANSKEVAHRLMGVDCACAYCMYLTLWDSRHVACRFHNRHTAGSDVCPDFDLDHRYLTRWRHYLNAP